MRSGDFRKTGVKWAMRSLVMAAVASGMMACGGVPLVGGADKSEAQDFSTGEAPSVGRLEPRRLDANECGLFLWERSNEPKLVLFSSNDAATAQMQINGREVSLGRISSDGVRFAGQFTEQTFRSQRGDLVANVSITQGEAISGGERVPSGTIRLTQNEGWEVVVSVAGLVGCQPG